MTNKNGFTLIELLAVIVVLAIVAAVTMTVIVPMLKDKPAEAAIVNLKEINMVTEKACAAFQLDYEQYGTIEDFTDDCALTECTLNPSDPAMFVDKLNVIGDAPDKLVMTLKECRVQTSCVHYSTGQFRNLTVKYNNGELVVRETTNDWKC